MKRSTIIIVLVLIVLGISVWIDSTERRTEKVLTSEGTQIRVLEAEAKGGVMKIVEPNGEMSIFSNGVKGKELSRIARKQETLLCQVDYSYHRIKRFIKKKLTH